MPVRYVCSRESKDLTLETNHWQITNPDWGESKSGWFAVFGSNYFLRYKEPNCIREDARYFFYYPKTAEHFYALYWLNPYWDVIFASYDLEEIKKFVERLQYKSYNNFKINDLPTKEEYKIVGDYNNFTFERID